MNNKRFDMKIYDDYLQDLYEAVYQPIPSPLKTLINDIILRTQYKYTEENNYLPYGVDELFLNYRVFPYVLSKKICYVMRTEIMISTFTSHIVNNNVYVASKHTIQEMKQILETEYTLYYSADHTKTDKKYVKFIADTYKILLQYKGKIDETYDYKLNKLTQFKDKFTSQIIYIKSDNMDNTDNTNGINAIKRTRTVSKRKVK